MCVVCVSCRIVAVPLEWPALRTMSPSFHAVYWYYFGQSSILWLVSIQGQCSSVYVLEEKEAGS